MIIGDGMADHALAALHARTPLQAALTPTLDMLASQHLGCADTTPKGFSPGTEIAIPLLLGYDTSVLTGRGPVEAAGMGIALQPNQWAMRMNLVTCDSQGVLLDACPELTADQALQRTNALRANDKFNDILHRYGVTLYEQPSFRQMLVGDGTRPTRLPTPPHNVVGARIHDSLPSDAFIDELMTVGREVLQDYALANAVWPWGCGIAPHYQPFAERFHVNGACVTAVPMVSGLARMCGLTVIEVPGATGTLHTDWRAKAAACVNALQANDFVLLHIEAPDDCSHAMHLQDKLSAIELVDHAARAVLDGMNGTPLRVLLCSDHYTCVETGQHDATPTPYSVWDSTKPPVNQHAAFQECQGKVVDSGTPIELLFNQQP